jgi:hypothetical protein
MRARGQALLTLVVVALLAAGVVGAHRFGSKAAPSAPPEAADAPNTASGAWFCPHGGGKGWTGILTLANPGAESVRARIASLGSEPGDTQQGIEVPPGGQVRITVPVDERGASSFVEYFGGWIAAGWVVRGAGGTERGIATEPCAATPSREQFVAGASTVENVTSYLTVMNPFAVEAVFDVSLFRRRGAPVRPSDLTDVALKPGRSVALKLNGFAEGEAALGVQVAASTGRVMAAVNRIEASRGISSMLAASQPAGSAMLPTAAGTGQSSVSVLSPGEDGIELSGTLLADEGQPILAGGLNGTAQEPLTAAPYPMVTEGPGALRVATAGEAGFVASITSQGLTGDPGSTTAAQEAVSSWVVLPAIAGLPALPRVVLVNGSDAPISVALRLLPGNDAASRTATVEIPGGSVATAPKGFFEGAWGASVQVTASQGEGVVALAAATSLGNKAIASYGLALGVPIPIERD